MVKLIWSPESIKDLEHIYEYIAQDSEYYAKLFMAKVIETIEKIPDFPKSGRIVPEYETEGIRERIYKGYRIVYRLKKESIEIVTVVQGAKLLPDI